MSCSRDAPGLIAPVATLTMGLVLWLCSPVALAVDTSDWDWGAVEADDTPVTAPRRRSPTSRTEPAPPPIAAPDLVAKPKTAYAVFEGLPPFSVIPSTKDAEMHPCGNCHRWAESDLTPRPLKEPHNNFALAHGLHGRGEFWCFSCHDLEGDGSLKTLEGDALDYDEAYLLCSQCHVDQARDWAFGAHGKRVGNWRGERTVYNCTACHYQHSPAIASRSAQAGPEVRHGLERPAHWVPEDKRDHVRDAGHRPWDSDTTSTK